MKLCTKKRKIPEQKAQRFYVYVIIADGAPIYVGKGTGTRCMAHLERPDMAHVKSLDIKVIYKDSEDEALLCEALLINAIGSGKLLNKAIPDIPSPARRGGNDVDIVRRMLDELRHARSECSDKCDAITGRVPSPAYNKSHASHPHVAREAAKALHKLVTFCKKLPIRYDSLASVVTAADAASRKRELRYLARCDDAVLESFLSAVRNQEYSSMSREWYVNVWNEAAYCQTSNIPSWLIDRLPAKERRMVTKARDFESWRLKRGQKVSEIFGYA